MPTYRICITCKESMSIDLFGLTGRNKDGKRYKRHTCNLCRAKYERVKRHDYKSRSYKADKFECVSDKHGGWHGAVMSEGTIKATMDVGYLSPGSEWIDKRSGMRYCIVGNEEWWFLQTYIGENSKVACESQRLREVRGSR